MDIWQFFSGRTDQFPLILLNIDANRSKLQPTNFIRFFLLLFETAIHPSIHSIWLSFSVSKQQFWEQINATIYRCITVGIYARGQFVQIAGLFFNIWPFTALIICPKVYKICQSRFKILPNSK